MRISSLIFLLLTIVHGTTSKKSRTKTTTMGPPGYDDFPMDFYDFPDFDGELAEFMGSWDKPDDMGYESMDTYNYDNYGSHQKINGYVYESDENGVKKTGAMVEEKIQKHFDDTLSEHGIFEEVVKLRLLDDPQSDWIEVGRRSREFSREMKKK